MEEVKSLETELNKIEEEQETPARDAGTADLEESSARTGEKSNEQDSVDHGSGSFSGSTDLRPKAKTLTDADDDDYNMKYARRGDCLIFAHEKYEPATKIPSRDSAEYDTRLCAQAFGKLGFEVRTFKDLKTAQFKKVLQEEGARDRSNCDAFVVVFMSHGDYKDGKEILHTYDGHVDTSTLWEPFVGNKCPSLAGKPKLFFIQACRGIKIDTGVGLKVAKDSILGSQKKTPNYVIPAHADLLVMWASYKGMFAFKSTRKGINGSVFIHFLAEILEAEGFSMPLHDLLLKVTRRVALDFESQCPNTRLDHNKQVPHTSSTLMRRLILTPKRQLK